MPHQFLGSSAVFLIAQIARDKLALYRAQAPSQSNLNRWHPLAAHLLPQPKQLTQILPINRVTFSSPISKNRKIERRYDAQIERQGQFGLLATSASWFKKAEPGKAAEWTADKYLPRRDGALTRSRLMQSALSGSNRSLHQRRLTFL